MYKIILLICIISSCTAFYLPGVAPKDFLQGENVELKVEKLSSSRNQLPYDYYSLPFCKPPEGIKTSVENLGEVLNGDRIRNSPYQLKMRVPKSCSLLCRQEYSLREMKKFSKRIKQEYRIQWLLDNLPAATKHVIVENNDQNKVIYERGFSLGFMGDEAKYPGTVNGVPYINNHVKIIVKYHAEPSYEGYRVVGFEVVPYSVQHKFENNTVTSCDTQGTILSVAPQSVDKEGAIVWTYDVEWEPSNIKWASRWDAYLLMTDAQIHWFSIINSLMIVFFLTGMVAMIMLRTLRRDLSRFNKDVESQEELQEETGWKQVHGDVYRTPVRPMLLSVFVGTGAQLLGMGSITVMFAVLGFLSPANRGGLLGALLCAYVLLGMVAGYYSATLYKAFKGFNWKQCMMWTACGFPGLMFTIYIVMDLVVWSEGSTGAVPFSTIFALLFLWLGVSLVLVFVGSIIGYRKPAFEPPVRTNQIPRQIPEQVWYMKPLAVILMGGILPFGAVFIELFFILSSMWLNQFYYLFGFLFIVFIILIATCAEISIVMVYFQLCAEDYHWWWRSFMTSGTSAFYMFMYSTFYYVTKLEIVTFESGMLYFCYTFMLCAAFFLMTGTVGFGACFWFVNKIFASIKVD